MNAATKATSISAAVALVMVAVWLFWPLQLGGGTTYVGTHGISMEPRFHTGDLAILRSAPSYAVGDVVAYRSESLNTTVMHRIVALDDDRFVLQGDNNTWLDEDHPEQGEVLGKLFLRVPQGGTVLGTLRSPAALVVLGLVTAVLGALVRRPRGRHATRSSRRRRPALRAPSFPMPIRARARQTALTAGGIALLASVAGGVLLAVPSTQTDTRTLEVTQRGEFSYSGSAEPGTTYPDGVVSTGDTVWTNLASGVTVSFADTISGTDVAGLQGAMRLDVAVASSDGWSAYLTSSPVVDLVDGKATATAPVDAAQASALLRRHYAEIGVQGGSATLTVTPVVAAAGTVRGLPFETGSPAALAFTLDANSLRPAGDAAQLAPTTTTPVTVQQDGPRRFEVLGVAVPIALARFVAAAALALALVVLAAATWIGRTARGDVADEFVVKHAARILPVAAFDPGPTVIDVADPESLRKVAERFDTLVLHHAGPEADVFAVRDVDATYRFVVPGGTEARARPPVPVPAEDDLTAPLPVVVPAPLTSVSAGLWGRFA
jgi:signal peptidase I